jgi:hypothetical protein
MDYKPVFRRNIMGAFTLDQTYIRQYDGTWQFLYQQDVSFLRQTVRNETQQAEKKAWNYIAPTQGLWDVPRHSDSPDIATQHSTRWCSMNSWTWSELVEDIDIIQTLGDPSSDYMKNAVSAAHRGWDEKIIQGLYGISYTGKDGVTPVNWYDVGECIGINGDGTLTTAGSAFTNTTETGLTLGKIAMMGSIMDNNNVPSSDRHLVANTDQKWYLLSSTKTTSADYNTVKALTDGQLNTFMGFTFHWLPADRFTADTTDTGCYQCAAYHKSAILMSTGIELKTRLAEESGKNFAVRVWARYMAGSVRLQGKGVVPFLVKKAPILDATFG